MFQGREPSSMPSIRRVLLWTLASAVALAGAVLLLIRLDYFAGDFRNNLWAPAHYLVHGKSPYLAQELFHDNYPVWLAPVIGLFFPLGWLDLRTAANLWFLGNMILLVAILRWFHRTEAGSLPLPAVLVALLFPAIPIHFLLGQFSLLAVWLLLVSAGLVARRRFLAAGFLLALVLSKPQLALLALPGLWVAAQRVGKVRGALLLPAGILAGLVLSTLPLWIVAPGWVSDFLWALQQNPQWFQPTLFSVLPMWLGPAGWAIAAAVALPAFVMNLWLWWHYPPQETVPWSLGLTTIATPYLWTWDMVLLIPLVVRFVVRQRGWPARMLWVIGTALGWGLILVTGVLTDGSDHWHFWIPWFFLLLILIGQVTASRTSPLDQQPLLQKSTR